MKKKIRAVFAHIKTQTFTLHWVSRTAVNSNGNTYFVHYSLFYRKLTDFFLPTLPKILQNWTYDEPLLSQFPTWNARNFVLHVERAQFWSWALGDKGPRIQATNLRNIFTKY